MIAEADSNQVIRKLRRPGVDVMITIFCNFWQFSAKIGFFLKNLCYDQIFSVTSSSLSKTGQYFAKKY
jgi:hypothetical protein